MAQDGFITITFPCFKPRYFLFYLKRGKVVLSIAALMVQLQYASTNGGADAYALQHRYQKNNTAAAQYVARQRSSPLRLRDCAQAECSREESGSCTGTWSAQDCR